MESQPVSGAPPSLHPSQGSPAQPSWRLSVAEMAGELKWNSRDLAAHVTQFHFAQPSILFDLEIGPSSRQQDDQAVFARHPL